MIFMVHIHVMYRNSLVQNGSNPLISVQAIWQQIEGMLGMSDSGC